MGINLEKRPLKVCSTCRYWVYRYKGLCTRVHQGVGKFWICEDWMAADDRSLSTAPAAEAPVQPSS
jgi:hypothetical protein